MMRVVNVLRVVVINVIVTACLLEIALRAQQKIGPLINLDVQLTPQFGPAV